MPTDKTNAPPQTIPTKKSSARNPVVNTTDATRGQALVLRAQKRKAELLAAMAALPADALRARGDIELALSSVEGYLTGNLAHLTDATAVGLDRWLEGSKHLAEKATRA